MSITRPDPAPARFDSECDIGAIVYGPHDDPDGLLRGFAGDLRAWGFNARGIVQTRKAVAPSALYRLDWVTLPDLVPLRQSDGGGASGSEEPAGLTGMLRAAEGWLRLAIRQRPDLVVVNRFGSAELAGFGLLSIVQEAVAEDVPVLLAVPKALFGEWLRYSEGLAVRLECTPASLYRWWRSLRQPFPSRAPPNDFCSWTK